MESGPTTPPQGGHSSGLSDFNEEAEGQSANYPALVLEGSKPTAQAMMLQASAKSTVASRFDTPEKRRAALDAGVNPMEILRQTHDDYEDEKRLKKRRRLESPDPSEATMEPTAKRPALESGDPANTVLDIDETELKDRDPDVESEPSEAEDEQSEADFGKAEDADATELTQQTSPFPFSKNLRFQNIRNPGQRLFCMISVNNGGLLGSFNPVPKGWAVQLYLDAGRYASPTMTMRFTSDGPDGNKEGIIGWCLSDVLEDDWMLNDLEIHRVANHPQDKKVSHREVLSACQDDTDRKRLICVSFNAWPKILSYGQKNQWKHPKPYLKKLLKAVFQGRHPYHMRIWFLAPAGDEEKFERCCLAFFIKAFETRRLPFAHWQDDRSVAFLDQLQERPPPTHTTASKEAERGFMMVEEGAIV